MASVQDLKRRIRSVRNTRKITRAMELVAAAKLRRAELRIKALRPYAETMNELIAGVGRASASVRLPLLEQREEVQTVAIVPLIEDPDLAKIVLFAIMAIAAVATIIYVQEGQRRIPIQYASRVRGRRMYQGGQTFLPLRVNQAGVIPIIFAVSILLFPSQIASYFTTAGGLVGEIATAIVNLLGSSSPLYVALYFFLTVGFTYFYTAFTFKPDETAEQLRKNGGFIPGIRPGRPTQDYLARVVTRITVAGAIFLGVVAALPPFISLVRPEFQNLALGGTGILIVVSVVVETMKQLEAQLLIRQYEGFIK